MRPIIFTQLLFAALSLRAQPVDFMPRASDYTYMWWAQGFPSVVPQAQWQRIILTGQYAFCLDTQSLRILHLGPVTEGRSYEQALTSSDDTWRKLPAADLRLRISANGKSYRCVSGGKWTQVAGPRLIESGRFLQRGDVTDLSFAAEDGSPLNVDARFETVAWPDRLSLILATRPGIKPIVPGEACFGRIGGGYGLDGTNHLQIPHAPEIDPEQFTLELWAYIPVDCESATRAMPWLVCKNHHEQADGNYGITISRSQPLARLNIGGGRDNAFTLPAKNVSLKTEAWSHLAMTYDGDELKLFVNGQSAGELKIGRKRVPGKQALAIGRRGDGSGDGYHFRGAVDELRIYDRALTADEIKSRFRKPESVDSAPKPVREWTFAADGQALPTRPRENWKNASVEVELATFGGVSKEQWKPAGEAHWNEPDWREVAIVLDPRTGKSISAESPIKVAADSLPDAAARPVTYEPLRGWHRINLDGIEPTLPPGGGPERQNDAIERFRLRLTNPIDEEQVARLMFEKTSGIRQRIGSPITGISAVLRYPDGQPTGIPVQLSKNWHSRPETGLYAGQWFHGISCLRLPPGAKVELELAIVYGHWGGVAAASHAQLCLIGWGSNQLWNQSALGAWGESICYEPDQVQAQCTILDVRPLMVKSMSNNALWSWTHNVGGGDFLRVFDLDGKRLAHWGMRTAYSRQGPCLTEVSFAGHVAQAIDHSATVSLARTDDIVRGTYRIRMDVKQAMPFSRLVLFQIGADTYSYTGERKMAMGNETGLTREWDTQWGGSANRTEPMECKGDMSWVSLHEAVARSGKGEQGAWANRGVVIRSWKARLGGKDAGPWMVEHGVGARGSDTSTLDIVPPPQVKQLEPGDFLEATVEHLIVPQFAKDYYGPNKALREALETNQNTWRMIHREAIGNDRHVETKVGKVTALYPAVTIETVNDSADFTLRGGLGYVPLLFTGLTSPRDHRLLIDDKPLDQSVHGNDFWQCDYDAASGTWAITFNLPVDDQKPRHIRLVTSREK